MHCSSVHSALCTVRIIIFLIILYIINFLAVEKIIRNHHKEEIKRRMSHGEILKLSTSDINTPRPANGLPPISPSSTTSTASSSSVNDYKNLVASREEKPDYFKASVMVRSQSSSSNTSR